MESYVLAAVLGLHDVCAHRHVLFDALALMRTHYAVVGRLHR